MKLSTKGRYAMIALTDLANVGVGGLTSLSEISERQDISLAYLEQLFVKLRRAKIVESVRGPGGGYRLGKPPQSISVADIIMAVDESIDSTRCQGNLDCNKGECCLTHHLWNDLSDRLYQFLDGINGNFTTDIFDEVFQHLPGEIQIHFPLIERTLS